MSIRYIDPRTKHFPQYHLIPLQNQFLGTVGPFPTSLPGYTPNDAYPIHRVLPTQGQQTTAVRLQPPRAPVVPGKYNVIFPFLSLHLIIVLDNPQAAIPVRGRSPSVELLSHTYEEPEAPVETVSVKSSDEEQEEEEEEEDLTSLQPPPSVSLSKTRSLSRKSGDTPSSSKPLSRIRVEGPVTPGDESESQSDFPLASPVTRSGRTVRGRSPTKTTSRGRGRGANKGKARATSRASSPIEPLSLSLGTIRDSIPSADAERISKVAKDIDLLGSVSLIFVYFRVFLLTISRLQLCVLTVSSTNEEYASFVAGV